MGVFCKLMDAILFFVFAVVAIAAPLIDGQTCFADGVFPKPLTDLKRWYAAEFGDYFFEEKPSFFVGLIWLELVFQWPLAVANIYAILAGKSWLPTTCLLYGSSVVTSMGAILGEMVGSGKASDKMMMLYAPFLGFGVLAILRGLVSHSTNKGGPIGRRPAMLSRKKRA